MTITLLILAVGIVLLASNLLRTDVTAILIVFSLAASGVLDVPEALSGFSSTAVIIIACMFIVGKAITHTGIAQRVGSAIIKYGGSSETKLMVLIMLAAGLVGAFMSSTATAAIFIPITLSVAEKSNLNHKRLLMPLAVAALISGMMTLVATTPNIVSNSALLKANAGSLSFFSFTPFGLAVLALAMVFMALVGRDMLASKASPVQRTSEPTIDDLLTYYQIEKNEYLFRVTPQSDLVEQSVARVRLGADHHVILLAVQSYVDGVRTRILAAGPERVLREWDLLLVVGTPEAAEAFAESFSLQRVSLRPSRRRRFFEVVGIAEVMLNPDSSLIGKTLKETLFQSVYHSMVLGIRRKGVTLAEDIADTPLKFGDVLLLCGSWTDILRLGRNKEQYLLLTMPRDSREYVPGRDKEKIVLVIMAVMVGLMVCNILPPVLAILAATVALVLLRCVPITSIYEVIDWQTIIMIAGILPLALALQKTGVIAIVSDTFQSLAISSGAGAAPVLAGLFLLTAALGLFISNTAVAVLISPMAVDIGLRLGINPEACAMTVAIACSAAFVSPLGSPVAMIVREPGGYSFLDYAKVGIPLLILALGVTVALCHIIYL